MTRYLHIFALVMLTLAVTANSISTYRNGNHFMALAIAVEAELADMKAADPVLYESTKKWPIKAAMKVWRLQHPAKEAGK